MPESPWGGKGRPRGVESDRRRHEFLRVLTQTGSFDEAIRQSGMSAKRLPKILDEDTFRAVCVAIMNGRAPNPLAVVVEPPIEAAAA